MNGIIALGAIVFLALIFVKMAVVIIPQSETRIIERLGKYYATLKPGINIIIPFIDRAKSIITIQRGRYVYSNSIDLREQVYDFDRQNVITKDNIQMQITALLSDCRPVQGCLRNQQSAQRHREAHTDDAEKHHWRDGARPDPHLA